MVTHRTEISILLPVHNRRCRKMVELLKKQCDAIDRLRYEIIAVDDGSTDKAAVDDNAGIDAMDNCRYIVNETNAGAAATRNRLAETSRYAWLLFVDCDVTPADNNFVARYLDAPETGVVSGGLHPSGTDDDARTNLRYAYERRAAPLHTAAARRVKPYQAFRSVNFMVAREMMLDCRFDERMRRYEDVMLGRRLAEKGVEICHIDNDVVMDDFESNEVFVAKTEKDMRTLREYEAEMEGYSRILDLHAQLRRWRLLWIVRAWHKIAGRLERRLLVSNKARLRLYDLYKLGYYVSLR